LIDDDQPLLGQAVIETYTLPPVPPPATLRSLLARVPSLEDLAGALAAVIAETTGTAPARMAPDALLSEADVRVRAEHYRDPAWTWRR
jgi:hypothetical protein